MRFVFKAVSLLICVVLTLTMSVGCGKKESSSTGGSPSQNTSSVTDSNTDTDDVNSGGMTENTTSDGANQGDENQNVNSEINFGDKDTESKPNDREEVVDETAPLIYLDAVLDGDIVTLNVCAKNNPGFASFRFKVNYDKKVLTAQKVKKGVISVTSNLQQTTDIPEYVTAVYVNTNDVKDNGTLFTISFEVADKNATSTDFSITLVDGFINSQLQDVKFYTKSTSLSLK